MLSDGLLITAAEIQSMEVVPEMVFLNCCHLGRVTGAAFNRLAHSISRELIDIGVRAVVVAGWAVDDRAASEFAETFYGGLLEHKLSFGEAVFEARKRIWGRYPNTMTWGAYQAYCGDPGWAFDVQRTSGSLDAGSLTSPTDFSPVSSQEVVARLEATRHSIVWRREPLSRNEAKRIVAKVHAELLAADRAGGGYTERTDVSEALGMLYFELGPEYFDDARRALEKAVTAQTSGTVRSIEQLANVEARLGAREPHSGEMSFGARKVLIRRAIARVKALGQIALSASSTSPPHSNRERRALLGSAYKRLAVIKAREFVRTGDEKSYDGMLRALQLGLDQYEATLERSDGTLVTYAALNWLFFQLLRAPSQRAPGFPDLAQRTVGTAHTEYRRDSSFWNAVTAAEVHLFEKLRELAAIEAQVEGDGAVFLGAAIDDLARRYREVTESNAVSPKEYDSVLSQIRALRDFYSAGAKRSGLTTSAIANHLDDLARRLDPSAGKAV